MPLMDDYVKEEIISGVVYDMSTTANYRHGLVNGNICVKLKLALKGSSYLPFMANLDYHYEGDEDHVVPDVIIVDDRSKLKGGRYYGTTKFIVETLSPATIMRDRGIKMKIYENCGVSEYWIVSPREKALEVYYLEDGKYVLQKAYILEEHIDSKYYNAKEEIVLREFPVSMLLEEIFEGF